MKMVLIILLLAFPYLAAAVTQNMAIGSYLFPLFVSIIAFIVLLAFPLYRRHIKERERFTPGHIIKYTIVLIATVIMFLAGLSSFMVQHGGSPEWLRKVSALFQQYLNF